VVASTPGATHALYRASSSPRGEAGRVQVPRCGQTPLTLLVEPHPQAAYGSAAAVVFATDAAARGPRDEELAARHGLTPAECCVAQLLCAGADLEQIARELAISRNTVRGHLKQIFCKTRSHRQTELVCKLLSDG
jgi:DNA-binding CsgD family transcriptional regulator